MKGYDLSMEDTKMVLFEKKDDCVLIGSLLEGIIIHYHSNVSTYI